MKLNILYIVKKSLLKILFNIMFKVGYIGLGRMGYHISKNINKKFKTFVWNRTEQKAIDHSLKYNTKNLSLKNLAKQSDVIMLCLPTSNEVNNIINDIYPYLRKNQIIIDNTSSNPFEIKNLYNSLLTNNIQLLDAPVSGGPTKAEKGTLSCMVGGDKNIYNNCEDILNTFSNPEYVGNIGNGCAIKSINNIINTTNLLVLTEGLKALKDYGIDIELALKVINKSSGRSLMSLERFPKHIIEGNYNYGFSLELMEKDIKIADSLINEKIMFRNTLVILDKYNKKYKIDKDTDYTELTKFYFYINNE